MRNLNFGAQTAVGSKIKFNVRNQRYRNPNFGLFNVLKEKKKKPTWLILRVNLDFGPRNRSRIRILISYLESTIRETSISILCYVLVCRKLVIKHLPIEMFNLLIFPLAEAPAENHECKRKGILKI